MSDSSSRTTGRRLVTRGLVAVAGLGIAAGALAPAASAAPIGVSDKAVVCSWVDEYRVGPVFGGRTEGNCGAHPGQEFRNTTAGGTIVAVGQAILPGVFNYSAWVDKFW
ncbi:hypothetical protein [Corynebacterium nuruki]|uniref:Uncharacterized protein n=1 Tax=Corynebacterium nuruki TaxID=1032851 RepID=A0A3D4SYH7_9CORY|nr:hypothetical protein [Corynebacterium nuruki]